MTRIAAILLSFLLLCAASGAVLADPPGRAARLAAIRGDVSFSPAGESDWLHASVNRPLTIGDRLWTDRGSRAELQLGGSIIRMGENTSLTLLNLDDDFVQVQVDEGTVSVRTRRLSAGQSVEVATPNLAFATRQPGSYRIEVDPQNDDTSVIVRSGRGEVYGERASFAVDSRQAYRFAGTRLRNYEVIPAPRVDEFERWASERDRRFEGSISARYVSPDVVGYDDLDTYGSWTNDPQYGYVWSPSRVASDWSPYRDGRWTWVEPWGWTWVDDQPWGYAVSHYGRWANTRNRWVWVPAPVRSRAVYAPALVAFVGGIQLSVSAGGTGNVAWFPLGPRDVYRPSYQASRGYFERINRGNTTLSNAAITNVYNNTTITTNMYVNQRVRNAVVGVPADAFVRSQPVAKAAVTVSPQAAASAPVAAGPSTKPARESVRGAASVATAKPPAPERERRVVARRAPPPAVATAPAPASSTAEPQKGAAPKPPAGAAPQVIVAAPPQTAPPTAAPPAKAPEGRPSDRKGGDRQARKSDDGKMSTAPATAPAAPTPPAATPPAAATQPVAPKAQAEVPPAKSGGDAEKRDGGRRAAEKAAADKAAAEKGSAERAAAEKRDADRRAAEKAAADKAVAEKGAAERAASEKRDADRRAAEKAAAERAGAEKAAAEKAGAERAAGEKRDADRRAAEKAAADRAAAEKAGAEKAAAERAAGEKRDADRRANEKAAAERAGAERAAAERAAGEKRDADRRNAEKAAAERGAAEKRDADRRAAEKAGAEKAAAEKQAAEKKAAEKKAAEKKGAEKKGAEKDEGDAKK